MDNQSNWKNLSDDISEISKKIKSNLTNDENVEDLKKSLKNIKDSMSESINELFQIVEKTVHDEDIKKDALNVISGLKNEIAQTVDTAKDKVSEMINHEGIRSQDYEEE